MLVRLQTLKQGRTALLPLLDQTLDSIASSLRHEPPTTQCSPISYSQKLWLSSNAAPSKAALFISAPRPLVIDRPTTAVSTTGEPGFLKKIFLTLGGYYSKESKFMRSADYLYTGIKEQATNPSLLQVLEVPDTFQHVHSMLNLHMWLILVRLRAEGKDGMQLAQSVYDNFQDDVETRTRNAGVKVRLAKQLEELEKQFYGSSMTYDKALKGDSNESLATALLRNVYQNDPSKGDAALLLERYVKRELACLSLTPSEAVMAVSPPTQILQQLVSNLAYSQPSVLESSELLSRSPHRAQSQSDDSDALDKDAAPTEGVLSAWRRHWPEKHVETQFQKGFAELFSEDSATNLAAVIESYKFLLDNIPPGQLQRKKKPIIVIDAVDALKLWKHEDAAALKELLQFFKLSCQQYHTAHVVLATSSEYFLLSWLESQGFNANVRRDEVLGHLTSAEAFVYLCGGKVLNSKSGFEEDWPGLIAKSEKTVALGMTLEDWKKVWSVCCGNMYLLKVCVGYAKRYNSWDKGVSDMLSQPSMAVTKALNYPEVIGTPLGSSTPRLWEAKHYKAVLRLIAANPYHAVRLKEVHAALEKVDKRNVVQVLLSSGLKKVGFKTVENATAAHVLLSMVEFNVLCLRPYSKMAKDIPREAFFEKVGGKEKQDNVVTIRSPAHLAAVLLLETKFQNQYEAERARASAEESNGSTK